jgi:hypothetical protein
MRIRISQISSRLHPDPSPAPWRLAQRPHDQALASLHDKVTSLLVHMPKRGEEAI